jgi:tetratricopeptide (TPR) repeat protein
MQAAALTTGTERSDESARRYRSLSRKFSAIRTRGGTLRLRAGSFNTSDEDTTEPSVTPRSLETIVHITEPEQDELLLKEYSFKNETIMEVVYSMMLFSQRRQLHASIARWYETNHAQNLSAFAAILGYHWKLSEQNLKQASKYYIQAGEQALRSFSNQEAVTFFLEALQVETKSMKPKSKVSIPSTLRKSFIPNPVDEDDLFGLLHLYRKLGQAYYNLGNFAQSNKHLQQALKVVKINAASFGESIPVKPDDRLLKDLSTLMAADAYVKREVVLALLTMARVNYYSCNRRASAYCNIVALTLTIRADFWAEQSEAYAQCIVSVGLAGAHQLAGAYVDMGHKLTSGKLDLSSHVHQNAGLYYSSRAVWKKSEFAFKASIDMAQKTGDRRRFEEGNIFLALNHYLQGQFRKSLLASTKSLDSARLRGDIQCQILALSSQVCCHLTLGNILKAASKLDQIRVAINRDRADNFVKQSSRSSLLETTGPKTPKKSGTPRQSLASGDVASDINYFALMGILSLFKNEPAEALRMANQAEEIFRSKQLEPTAFFTFPGYMVRL